MSNLVRSDLRLLWVVAIGGVMAFGGGRANAQPKPRSMDRSAPTAFRVDGTIALHSLMSLSDAHLQKLADVLTIIGTTDGARSGEWERIRPALAEAARMNAPAAHWFARSDGTYWTLEQGLETRKISDRAYFPRVLAGKTVIGDLVVSRSTHRNSAIVAVPVRGGDRSVIGVLGASVHLDSLGALVRQQMGGLRDGLLFFAIDATPRGAIHSDPSLIFTEPMKLGDESMRRAFTRMLSGQEGVVTYTFQGSRRTVLYRKSPLSNWWYGLGVVQR